MSQINEPKFKLIKKMGNIEIREYDSLLAQVEVTGDRSLAIKTGFRMLLDYISGNNNRQIKIPMTAPVLQQAIDNDKNNIKTWKISFFMPITYQMNNLLVPEKSINIKELLKNKYIVIRFSGFLSDSNLSKNLEKLNQFTQKNNLQIIDLPVFAFYNPPWTLPFLRRNEIMLEIE